MYLHEGINTKKVQLDPSIPIPQIKFLKMSKIGLVDKTDIFIFIKPVKYGCR